MAKKKSTKTVKEVKEKDIILCEEVDIKEIPSDAEILDEVIIVTDNQVEKSSIEETLEEDLIEAEVIEEPHVEEELKENVTVKPKKVEIINTFWGYSWNGMEFEY